MPSSPKSPIHPFAEGDVNPGISMLQERLIGRVCVEWGLLESAMQDTLWNLLGLELEDGRILTARADAARKLQWLNAFATKHLSGAEFDSLKAVLDLIEEARQDRNFIMHGVWATHIGKGEPIAFSVREKSADPTRVVGETFPTGRMRDLVERIRVGKFALMRWANSHAKARGRPAPHQRLDQP